MKATMLHSENSAVGMYRIWQPAKYLKKLGWETAVTDDEMHTMKVDGPEGMEGLAKGSDIIVAQRPENIENVALFMAMRDQFQAPFVFEIDDNIYDVAKSSIAYQHWYPGSPRILVVELLMREANAITVTTENLKELYSKFNDNIFVLPNMQDPEIWDVKKNKSKNFTIGWAGSATHYDDLKMIWKPIKRFLYNHKDARFKVVGANCDFLEGHPQVEIVTEFAGIRDYPQYLADLGFDVGVVPVVNRAFNLGKSNIKWQEYSMAGIPTIASNLGEYKEIEHEVTGLLASSDEWNWLSNLEKIYDDRELGSELASNAKQYILKNLNIKERIGEYDRIYRDIIRKYKSS